MTHPRTAGFDAARPLIGEIGLKTMTPGLVKLLDAFADAAGVPRVEAPAGAGAGTAGLMAGMGAVSGPPAGGSAPDGAPAGAEGQSGPLPGLGAALDPDIARVDVDLLDMVSIAPRAALEAWVEPIRRACAQFEINTIRRVAAFIAQMAHESDLKPRDENLNYRAARLVEVWPNRFPTIAAATPYAHNPEKLANKVYANRMGNGNEASGDGWRFRGGGPLQLTGRSNWQGFADAMGMPLDQALVWGRTLEGGIMGAAWFWETNDINRLADTPGVADETRRINGGTNGLADREAKFNALVAEMLRREKAGK